MTIRYECDKCGASLGANDPQRYLLKIEVYAATGNIEFDEETVESTSSQLREVIEQLAQADPNDLEDRTYRSLSFDLCDPCRADLLKDPLGTGASGS